MRLPILLLVGLCASTAYAQDRDGDRVPDAADLCPDARETPSTLFSGDGCPDGDGDHDGVVDDYDVCPAQAETVNGFRDLDGCPDAPTDAPRWARCIAGVESTVLLQVSCSEHGARLSPRQDAPLWLGAASLDCYASVAFDGRQALHCQSADASVEVTLAMRIDGSRAIGAALIRSSHGRDVRAWSGTVLPVFDRQSAQASVLAHGDELQACGEGAVGRVSIAFTVETTGEIDAVHVASDTVSPPRPAVGECLVRIIDALTIAAPPRSAPVTLSLGFVFELEP